MRLVSTLIDKKVDVSLVSSGVRIVPPQVMFDHARYCSYGEGNGHRAVHEDDQECHSPCMACRMWRAYAKRLPVAFRELPHVQRQLSATKVSSMLAPNSIFVLAGRRDAFYDGIDLDRVFEAVP